MITQQNTKRRNREKAEGELMRTLTIIAVVAAALAGAVWTATPAQAGRSCSDAHAQCKKFCSGRTDCLSLCQNRFNSCKVTGTFIWTTQPVEKGLEKR